MISFFVPGKPIPQGSAKAFSVGGKARVFTGASNESTPLGGWRARIAHFSRQEMGSASPFAGATGIFLLYVFERPKALAKKLKSKPISRRCGDLDKLQRAVLDGLTGVVFNDDSQVIHIEAAKAYAGDPDFYDHQEPGVAITVFFGEEIE